MPRPKAYDPQYGYKYQLIIKQHNEKQFEHLDYAKDKKEKDFLIQEYKLAYSGSRFLIHWILLPKKYWEAKPNEKANS